jgi:hypothetical protein
MRLELQSKADRSACTKDQKIPDYKDITMKSKKSDYTQESHYFLGNSMFRNVYHLGTKKLGNPSDLYLSNMPTDQGKNYLSIPFTLKADSNLITVNLFQDWVEDRIMMFILKSDRDIDKLYNNIKSAFEKSKGLKSVKGIENVYKSSPTEYHEGIQRQTLSKGDYKLILMNMDMSENQSSKVCMMYTLSIFIEEELERKNSRSKTGLAISSGSTDDSSVEEAVIETITLCPYSFLFTDIFSKVLSINGGVLSIDSTYRYDDDEKSKLIEFNIEVNSVIYIKVTDIYNEIK